MKKEVDGELKRHRQQIKKVYRNPYWFEKFYFFITSQNFLVIAGRDFMQNEVIIKKYTEKFDLVFHTCERGSPFVVLKLPEHLSGQENTPLPANSIQEAAQYTVDLSKNWNLKVIGNVFYVRPS